LPAFDGGFASLIVIWLLASCRIMFVPKFRRKLMPPSSRSLDIVQLGAEQRFPPKRRSKRVIVNGVRTQETPFAVRL